jgi:hypothetical protein
MWTKTGRGRYQCGPFDILFEQGDVVIYRRNGNGSVNHISHLNGGDFGSRMRWAKGRIEEYLRAQPRPEYDERIERRTLSDDWRPSCEEIASAREGSDE